MQKNLGHIFELVPQQGGQPQAGQPLKVLVLLNGRPQAGVRLSWGEHDSPVTSDAQGMAAVVPASGTNILQAHAASAGAGRRVRHGEQLRISAAFCRALR